LTKRICLVTTTAFIANAFLRPHLRMLARQYEVTLALNVRDRYPLDDEIARTVTVRHVPIERKVSAAYDVAALVDLARLFRRERFDLVHSVSPKAGLLAMAAAAMAGVRVRLHTFQGEVWASRRGGIARAVLKIADSAVARLATHALVVSRGEQSFLERKGILRPGHSFVLGHGSIAGVDTERFRPDPRARAAVRAELGIPADAFLALYLGRIGRDKGVLDLAHAFATVAARGGEQWLAFVGPDEEGLRKVLEEGAGAASGRVRFVAYTRVPQRYLAAADVVCLPSYREGFGLVLIEAGACGVPVLASRLYGTSDAVVEGVTGLFHEPRDVADMARQLQRLAHDPEFRSRMGREGRGRVETHFREALVVQAMEQFYAKALGNCAR
jgi:glycosyltransferase involved in cell wall biosynthesis